MKMELIQQIFIMEEKTTPHQIKINEYKEEFEEEKRILMENKMKSIIEKKARLKKEERRRKEEISTNDVKY